jgi:hypothetical protein
VGSSNSAPSSCSTSADGVSGRPLDHLVERCPAEQGSCPPVSSGVDPPVTLESIDAPFDEGFGHRDARGHLGAGSMSPRRRCPSAGRSGCSGRPAGSEAWSPTFPVARCVAVGETRTEIRALIVEARAYLDNLREPRTVPITGLLPQASAEIGFPQKRARPFWMSMANYADDDQTYNDGSPQHLGRQPYEPAERRT